MKAAGVTRRLLLEAREPWPPDTALQPAHARSGGSQRHALLRASGVCTAAVPCKAAGVSWLLASEFGILASIVPAFFGGRDGIGHIRGLGPCRAPTARLTRLAVWCPERVRCGAAMVVLVRPEGTAAIQDSAHEDRTDVAGMFIPASVKHIGRYAFNGCTSITALHFAQGLESIGIYTFHSCSGIVDVDLPASVKSNGAFAFDGCTGVAALHLVEGLESIGDNAFASCSGIVGLDLPASVKAIGSFAFDRCSGITALHLAEGLEDVGMCAFANCVGIIGVDLPVSLWSIGEGAFQFCTGITALRLPQRVKIIGDATFLCCSSTTDLDLREGLQSIGRSAFCACTALETLVLPTSLTSIDGGEPGGSFDGCTRLARVLAPDTLVKGTMAAQWRTWQGSSRAARR